MMNRNKGLLYGLSLLLVVFIAFASVVIDSVSKERKTLSNRDLNDLLVTNSDIIYQTFKDGNYLGYTSLEELYSEILSKGQDGFNKLMDIAINIDAHQFLKVNLLATHFSKTDIDASGMVDVVISRGSNAEKNSDIIALSPFISNMGLIGKTSEYTEDFLIAIVSNREFRHQVWPILDTLKSKQLYVENAEIHVIDEESFPGAEDEISKTVQVGNSEIIYIKNIGQSWDDINRTIIDESNGAAEWREVNDREQEIKLSAANALYLRGSEDGLSVLRTLMMDKNENPMVRDSIRFHLEKIREYGNMENYLNLAHANLQE